MLAAGIVLLSSPVLGADYRPGSSISTGTSASSTEGFLIGPFLFSPSAKVGASYDDNLFSVEDGFPYVSLTDPDGDGTFTKTVIKLRAQSGTIANGEARLALKMPFSHSYARLVYLPTYRDYLSLAPTRKTSHTVQFETKLNFSNGSSLSVRDDYFDGFFDARLLNATIYRLISTPYRRNDAQLDYDWSLAGFWGLAGRLQKTTFSGDKTASIGFADTSGSRRADQAYELFDYGTDLLETRGYYNFARFQVFASATLARTVQDRRKYNATFRELNCGDGSTDPACGVLIDEETISQGDLSFGVKGKFGAQTQGQMRAGYSSWRFASDQTEPFAGLSLSGNVDHQFSPRTTGYIKLERTATQATGQYSGYYIREEASLRISRQLTGQISVGAGLTYVSLHYPSATAPCSGSGCTGTVEVASVFRIKDYSSFLELNYRPGQATRPGPLLMSLQLTPRKSTSSLKGRGLDAEGNRATLTLQYGWF